MSASRFLAMAFACSLHAGAARAQAAVEAVQYPAWLERGGASAPLVPGTALRARDALVTGPEGRAAFRLAEGTVVRLGEKARVVLQRDELVVESGAFRLTSAPARAQEVAVRVGGIHVFGRGADLWGESGGRDVVALIAGQARAQAPGHPPSALERPLDRYEAPRGEAPAAGRWTGETLAQAVQRVEMAPDAPRAERGGRWRVFVGKFESALDARALRGAVEAAGFPAEVAGGAGGPFVVVVPGLAGETEARAAMARLRTVEGAGILTVNQAR